MKLSWKNFRNRKFMINCKTEKDAEELCQMMHDRGMRWSSGVSYIEDNNWECGVTTCYSGDGQHAPRMYYESEGYKVVTFQDFKAYHDQKLKPLWHSSDESPTTSKNVLVVTELGNLYMVPYSKKHNKFNVVDYDTDASADNLCLTVTRWCNVDDILKITSVSEKGTACR